MIARLQSTRKPAPLPLLLLLAASLWGQLALAEATNARDMYRSQKFDEVITATRGVNDNEARVLYALAYAERYALYRTKSDKQETKAALDALEGVLSSSDIETLAELAAISINPNGSAVAADLLDEVFEGTGSVNDMHHVLAAIAASPGPDATRSALQALQRYLAQVRGYVSDGGTMPEAERRFFERQELHASLLSLLRQKETRSQAKKCLVLVESPALAATEALGTADALETAREIRKAIAKREERIPQSDWYGRK